MRQKKIDALVRLSSSEVRMSKTTELIIAGIWRATSQVMLDAHLIVMRNHMPNPGSHEWFEIETTKAEVIENNFIRILH